MSQPSVPQYDVEVSFGLVRSYSRWTLVYLTGVLALWILGIEGIYESATPFYAMPKVVPGHVIVIFSSIVAFGWASLAAWSRYLGAIPPRRMISSTIGMCTAFFIVLSLFAASGYRPTESEDTLAEILRPLLPLIVFAAAAFGLRVALRRTRWMELEPSRRAQAWMFLGLVAFTVAFSIAIAMLRDGITGVSQAYARYDHEYVGDIGFGGSLRGLFSQYVPRHEYLSMHSKVHPPGPVALLWIMSYFVFSREALPMSLATIVVGSLGVIPLYYWVKDMLDHRVALVAALLYALMPSVVLFTATSADILFMPFTLLTLFFFWRALHQGSTRYAVAAGLMYGVISLLSFGLIGIGAFFGIVGIWRLTEPSRRRVVVQTALLMLGGFLVVHGLVWLWSGFDVVAAFRLAKAQFDLDQTNLDLQAPRWPSWVWKFFNPLAWLFFAGIPVSVLFVRRLAKPETQAKGLFVAFLLTLVALDFLYLARGEGERSALYVFPFFVVPAAHMLMGYCRSTNGTAPLMATLAFLAFQSWITETLFYTFW